MQAFTSCSRGRETLELWWQASQCGGFSCCRARALEHTGSAVVAHGLSCPLVCGILVSGPGSGIKPMSPALEGRFSITRLPGKYPLFSFEWTDTDTDETQQYTYNVLPHGFQDCPHLPGKVLGLRELKLDTWSEPQSAPGLVFVDCIELLHLWLQRI